MNSQQALKKLIDYTRGETPVDLFRIIQQDIYKLEKLEKALDEACELLADYTPYCPYSKEITEGCDKFISCKECCKNYLFKEVNVDE